MSYIIKIKGVGFIIGINIDISTKMNSKNNKL